MNQTSEDLTSDITASDEETVARWWLRLWKFCTNPEFVYVISFTLGIFLIFCYLIISSIFPSQSQLATSFLKELGFAYVVAAILGFSIEEFNKHRHIQHERTWKAGLDDQGKKLIRIINEKHSENTQNFKKEIAKNVIEAVYGASVPKEILNAVTRFVLQAKRIRHQYDLKIELRRLDEYRASQGHKYTTEEERFLESNRVVLISTTKFIDQNVTATAEDVLIPLQILKEGQDDHCDVTKMNFFKAFDPDESSEKQTLLYCASGDDLRKNGLIKEETPGTLKILYTANAVAPSRRIGVMYKRTSLHDTNDSHIVMSLPPCIRFTLSLRCSQSLIVTVSSIHTEDEHEVPRDGDWEDDERRWTLTTALLPCQGFVLNWRPLPSSMS